MSWLALAKILLGVAEDVVPIFIHNPQSQKIEGVIVTTANAVANQLAPTTSPAPNQAPAA